MTNSVQDDQPSDIGEETISFEDVVSEARIELSKPDPDEQPYPGAKAMRVLIQAQSLVDGGKVPDLMTQDRSLLEEYERTTKQEARTTLIERINRDLSTLLDEIETHADEDE
ncbi:hypothetical protein KKB40_00790 [Patescibacteria group bacterium]|nr:hypothetical protein [Patescibacteria group bacterium]